MSLKFTATIGCYKNDSPSDFRTAFLSIYNQTVRPDEIIITIDGPIPELLDNVIQECEQNYNAIVLRIPENRGQGEAHALAVDHASYDYIAIMDADDIAVPDRFEKQIKEFEKDSLLDIVGGQIEEFIDDPSNIVGVRRVPLLDKEIKAYLKKRCPFNHMSIMIKKSSVLNAGNYQTWHYNEDYFLYCRMMLQNPFFRNLPDTLVKVRVGKEMYQRRGGWKYFISEAQLQKWMLLHRIISFPRYVVNIFIRLCVQVLMPNWLRGFVFQIFFRSKVSHGF